MNMIVFNIHALSDFDISEGVTMIYDRITVDSITERAKNILERLFLRLCH